VRTIGIVRARAKIGLQNLAYNIRRLALQLLFMSGSESMGNHDSKIVDAGSVD